MEGLPEGTKAFLLHWLGEDRAHHELWRSGGREKGIIGDGKRVLGICAKRQRSVLVHDAEKDTLMRGIKFRSFHSALCVPVFDNDKSLAGLILLLSDEAGTFTNEHKFAVERSARDYGATLASKRRVTEVEEEESKTTSPGPFPSSVSLAAMALVTIFFLIWVGSPPSKEPVPVKTVHPPTVNQGAKENAEQFLAYLQEKNYTDAWSLLAPSLQSRWTETDFSQSLSTWSSTGSNKDILGQRRVHHVRQHDRQAQIVLLESAGDQGDWVWHLQEDGEWRITKIQGPVDSPGE